MLRSSGQAPVEKLCWTRSFYQILPIFETKHMFFKQNICFQAHRSGDRGVGGREATLEKNCVVSLKQLKKICQLTTAEKKFVSSKQLEKKFVSLKQLKKKFVSLKQLTNFKMSA